MNQIKKGSTSFLEYEYKEINSKGLSMIIKENV